MVSDKPVMLFVPVPELQPIADGLLMRADGIAVGLARETDTGGLEIDPLASWMFAAAKKGASEAPHQDA